MILLLNNLDSVKLQLIFNRMLKVSVLNSVELPEEASLYHRVLILVDQLKNINISLDLLIFLQFVLLLFLEVLSVDFWVPETRGVFLLKIVKFLEESAQLKIY